MMTTWSRVRVTDSELVYPGGGMMEVMAALCEARDRQLRRVIADLRARAEDSMWSSYVQAALSLVAREYEKELAG